MREIRPSGSEGGAAQTQCAVPTPILFSAGVPVLTAMPAVFANYRENGIAPEQASGENAAMNPVSSRFLPVLHCAIAAILAADRKSVV